MSGLLAPFLAFVPLFVLPGNDDPARLPQAVLLLVGALGLFAASRARTASSGEPQRASLFLPGASLLAWAALSAAWAHNPYEAAQVLFRWAAAFLLFLLVFRAAESTPHARRLLVALFLSSAGVAAAGLLQHLAGWEALPQAYPPAGTLANKNVAAGFVAMALPLGAVAFATASPRLCWAFSSALALSGAYVFHAGSRAAFLAVFVQALAAAVFLASSRRIPRLSGARRPALALGIGLFALLTQLTPGGAGPSHASPAELVAASARPVLRFLGGDRAASEPDALSRAERSVELRLAVWRNGLEMLREAPLVGVGLGNFGVQYPRFARAAVPDGTLADQRVEAAHNDYLQLAAELGLIGVLLLGWLGGAALRALAAAARRAAGEARLLALASGLGLAAIAVLAGVSPTLEQPAALVALATLLGTSSALGRRPASAACPGVAPASRSRYARDLRLAATAAALLAAGHWGHAEIRADRHVLAMARAEAVGDWRGVVGEGLEARRWNPLRKDPLFATASAYLRLGQPERAVPLLQELLADHPYHASALGNLGIARLGLGDLEGAASCFRRVLRLRGDDRLARLKLLEIHRLSGKGAL